LSIRKGAIGYIGGVSVSFAGNGVYPSTLNGIFYKNESIGESFSKSFVYDPSSYQTTLLGDPTFKFPLTNKLKYPLVEAEI
jgi:hypothetical protein